MSETEKKKPFAALNGSRLGLIGLSVGFLAALAAAAFFYLQQSELSDALTAAQAETEQLKAQAQALKADGEKAKAAVAALEAQVKEQQDVLQAANEAVTDAQAKLQEKCLPAKRR